ncbi:hypothetical protein [Anatilimnocola floriformis]|uniref:hypothetical protein n=1 Tax=Anatilimnocola floriformis TaxID=2948575 RepID=UPI0020C39ECA|nr:hypothetical protein [Anatilimnocola floriformis]
MSQDAIRAVLFLLATLLVAAELPIAAATPPRPQPVLPAAPAEPLNPEDTSLKKVATINWQVGGHRVTGRNSGIVQAVNIRELPPPEPSPFPRPAPTKYQLFSKKFDDPDLLRYSNGYASVVDEQVFSDLRTGSAHSANELGTKGCVIGRVKLKEFDSTEVARFLLNSSIIQAHIHLECTAVGNHYKGDSGDWYALHGEAAFMTMERYVSKFDFGVHVAPEGEIRLINYRDVGRPVPKDAPEQK